MATHSTPRESPQRRRVLLVDGHPITRYGLSQLINKEADLLVCGEAEDTPQAVKAVMALQPDLVMFELALRAGSGLDLITTLRKHQPEILILVLSMFDEALYAERVLQAGARGYIMKWEATEVVLDAIRRVLHGEIAVSERMVARIIRSVVTGRSDASSTPLARLSNRELDVLRFLGEGYSTRQIAEALHRSVKTVETHRMHITKKLGLANAAELIRYATQWVNQASAC